jgi:pyruvate formate lyase activating enzyme
MTDRPPTPISTLEKAREIGKEQGLLYIYLGNVPGDSNTNCYRCGKLLIQRIGYWVERNDIEDGKCPKCGAVIAGVWD